MLKKPPHGYGKNMNPCIDCHALMFKCAGEMMTELKADFIFSGEVLGERPMSQNRNSLQVVAKDSGLEEQLLRPLSARLLPPTAPEKLGLVDISKLPEIKGRSRKPQIALAKEFGITGYPEPAGGCKLTDPSFSKRLKHLLEHKKKVERKDLELLSTGRHFFTESQVKIIVGRDEKDNNRIEELCSKDDILLTIDNRPGPTVMVPKEIDEKTLEFAAAICIAYSNTKPEKKASVSVLNDNKVIKKIVTFGIAKEKVKGLIL
jgi:tRNA U34 2-thiouridine synthase MnmA/TrmU